MRDEEGQAEVRGAGLPGTPGQQNSWNDSSALLLVP